MMDKVEVCLLLGSVYTLFLTEGKPNKLPMFLAITSALFLATWLVGELIQ